MVVSCQGLRYVWRDENLFASVKAARGRRAVRKVVIYIIILCSLAVRGASKKD
jgi:hypothetical protein